MKKSYSQLISPIEMFLVHYELLDRSTKDYGALLKITA